MEVDQVVDEVTAMLKIVSEVKLCTSENTINRN